MSEQDKTKVDESQVDDDQDGQQNKPEVDSEGNPVNDGDKPDDIDDIELDGEDFDPKKVLAKIKKQNSELRNLRERAKEAESKVEKTSEDKDKEISKLQTQLLRERVGRKTGLPDQLVERLNGDDEESMLKDAEGLLEVFAKSRPPTTKPHEQYRGGGRPESEPVETDLSKIGARMFGR